MLLERQYSEMLEYKPKIKQNIMDELVDIVKRFSGDDEVSQYLADFREKVFRFKSHHLVDLEYFDEFKQKTRPKKYSRKTIIVDETAYYVPYHFDLSRYGIYFRISNIVKEFENFVGVTRAILSNPRMLRIIAEESEGNVIKLNKARKNLKILISTLFVEYLVFQYAHMMAHHVFEDIALLFEFAKKGKYAMLKSREEEAYCDYVAYTTLERYMPGVLQRSKKAERLIGIFYPLLPDFAWEHVISLNFATTKLLYVFYKARKQRERPIIDSKTRLKFEVLFRALWKLHYTFEEDIHAFKNRPVIQRIFITLK